MKNAYQLLPYETIARLLDAAKVVNATLDGTDELTSFVLRYSWIPIPPALRESQTRDTKVRLMEAVADVEGFLETSATLVDQSTEPSFSCVAEQIVNELPECIFCYSTREELVKKITAAMLRGNLLSRSWNRET